MPDSESLTTAIDRRPAGLRAYHEWRAELAAQAKAENERWKREWKAGAPERKRVAMQARKAKRRAAERVPAWADLDAIRAVYAEARRLTLETGIQHHVDHVLPIQGRKVCGLHVAENLQIILGTENSRKGNRWEPC